MEMVMIPSECAAMICSPQEQHGDWYCQHDLHLDN